jgi:pimeloyl-ACP methyl ester carboxylesterase
VSIEAPVGATAAQIESFHELPAPDYSSEQAWLRRRHPGGKVQDPAVFYVHPTTVRTLDKWFASPADPDTRAGAHNVVEEHGHAFPGNMWAPAYRQATTRAFHQHGRGGEQAYDLAFADVWRAFLGFLQEVPDGPIVLAGHSQGARHIVQILAALVGGVLPDANNIASRIVATYAIGIGIPDLPTVLGKFPLPSTREDTGVLVGWNARLDGERGDAGHRAVDGAAVNPISFNSGSVADETALHQGGVLAPFDQMRVSVECEGDVVWVRQLEGDELSLHALPDGSLHAVEVQLFARDIRDDLRRRTRQWRELRLTKRDDDITDER